MRNVRTSFLRVVEDDACPTLGGRPASGPHGCRGASRRRAPARTVLREVPRYPVEYDAYPALVAFVDEIHEVGRGAEPRGRRVEVDHLVPPRVVERMLHHRHQLDVGEPQPAHVRDELVRELAVGEVPGGRTPSPSSSTNRGGPHRPRWALSRPAPLPSASIHSHRPTDTVRGRRRPLPCWASAGS